MNFFVWLGADLLFEAVMWGMLIVLAYALSVAFSGGRAWCVAWRLGDRR